MMRMQTEPVQYSSDFSRQTSEVKKEASSSEDTFGALLAEVKEEFAQKAEGNDTKKSYAIGASSYTEDEWNKLVRGFDRVQEQLREAVAEEGEKIKKAAKEE